MTLSAAQRNELRRMYRHHTHITTVDRHPYWICAQQYCLVDGERIHWSNVVQFYYFHRDEIQVELD